MREYSSDMDQAESTQRAVKGLLDPTVITKSLRDLDKLYQNAGFNDNAKFGLLSQACMNVPDLV